MFNVERKRFGRGLLIRTEDHIIPLSRGGKNNLTNKIACCEECNRLKGNRTPKNFADAILFHGLGAHMDDLRKIMATRAYKIYNKRKTFI